MKKLRADSIELAVPGGLAGQLFAVCYAVWLRAEKDLRTHIQFYGLGTGISSFALGSLLDTPTAKQLGISYSKVIGNLSWTSTRSNPVVELARQKYGSTKAWSNAQTALAMLRREGQRNGGLFAQRRHTGWISLETLRSVSPGSRLIGYPVDYRVIEEAWPTLSKMIGETDLPNFSKGTGSENSVAVHWRLGDYKDNYTHGSLSWASINEILRFDIDGDLPIRIFTDSPDLARHLANPFTRTSNMEFISSDIWSDIHGMTRSHKFIGSHSGISFLSALAIRLDNNSAKTWLPDRWFLDDWLDQKFERSPQTFGGSSLYQPKFNEK